MYISQSLLFLDFNGTYLITEIGWLVTERSKEGSCLAVSSSTSIGCQSVICSAWRHNRPVHHEPWQAYPVSGIRIRRIYIVCQTWWYIFYINTPIPLRIKLLQNFCSLIRTELAILTSEWSPVWNSFPSPGRPVICCHGRCRGRHVGIPIATWTITAADPGALVVHGIPRCIRLQFVFYVGCV